MVSNSGRTIKAVSRSVLCAEGLFARWYVHRSRVAAGVEVVGGGLGSAVGNKNGGLARVGQSHGQRQRGPVWPAQGGQELTLRGNVLSLGGCERHVVAESRIWEL